MAEGVDRGDEEVQCGHEGLPVLDKALLGVGVIQELLLELGRAVSKVAKGITEGALEGESQSVVLFLYKKNSTYFCAKKSDFTFFK